MLCDLHALLRAGIIPAFCLEHGSPGLCKTGTYDGEKHDSQTHQDIFCCYASCQKSTHHHGNGRDLQRFKDCLQDPEQYRSLKFLSVFLSTEGKEFTNDFNHCLSPPCVLSTSSRRDHDAKAILHVCRCHRSFRLLSHRSGPRPQW